MHIGIGSALSRRSESIDSSKCHRSLLVEVLHLEMVQGIRQANNAVILQKSACYLVFQFAEILHLQVIPLIVVNSSASTTLVAHLKIIALTVFSARLPGRSSSSFHSNPWSQLVSRFDVGGQINNTQPELASFLSETTSVYLLVIEPQLSMFCIWAN